MEVFSLKKRENNALRAKGQKQKELVHYNVSRLKKESNLSNYELASLLNFSPGTVVAWESGARGITLKALFMIAEVFNVDVAELYKPRKEIAEDTEEKDAREAKFKKLQSMLHGFSQEELDCLIDTVSSIRTLIKLQNN